jgi:hypothetical protein
MNRLTLGIGIALAILVVLIAPAVAGPNTVYFVPQHSNAGPDEITYVELWLNLTDAEGIDPNYGFKAADLNITLDKDIGEIIAVNRIPGDPWDLLWQYNLGGFSGVADLHFSREMPRMSDLFSSEGNKMPDQVWEDGTFTCVESPRNFTKSLTPGWNLISLPLMPSDNSVSGVLGGVTYTAVYSYNATSKEFECPSTMDPEIGYFVDVTTASTWEYEGTPVSSTSPGLKSGLNMIGVPNCTMNVSDAMGSADYRYVAGWNAVDKKFEVYNPSAPAAFHGFTTMAAGEGYFVSAKSDDATFAISCPS